MAMINLLDGDAQQGKPVETATAPVEPQTVQAQPDTTDGGESKANETETLLAGKYKTVEELEKGYDALNSQQGQRGQEMDTLQTQIAEQNRQMAELLANQTQQAEQAQAPAMDIETERLSIGTKMDSGDLSIPEGLAQLRKLDAVETEGLMQSQIAEVQQSFEQKLAERDQEVMANRFHEANPEFAQLQQSGALQQIVDGNEFINDDFQAYLQFQANQAYTKGKDEAAKEIEGSAPAAEVSSNAGSQMRTETPAQPTGRMTDADNLSSGLAALEAVGFNK